MSNKLWWRNFQNLNPEQQRVLGLPPSGRYYVTGPAGSGKTNLLVLRARYLTKSNIENYVVLVYNGPLEKFLSSSARYGVANEKVFTFVSWMNRQLRMVVGPAEFDDLSSDLNERRVQVCERIREYLEQTGTRELIDTILVDEIQDYAPNEIRVLGMMAKNLFFVGDIRQQIYKSNILASAINEVIAHGNQIELVRHYRVGKKICKLADRIAKPSRGHKRIFDGCSYNENEDGESTVNRIQGNLAFQIERAVDTITEQLDAYPNEFIGVMCPRNETLRVVAGILESKFPGRVTLQQAPDYRQFLSTSPIVCSTLHNGKGLEYRCVHIIGTDLLEGMPRNRELIYTGVTRAKTSLTIYHEDTLIGYLADALAGNESPPPIPTPESLFE